MKNILAVILLLLLASCNEEGKVKSDLIEISNCTFFTDGEISDVLYLKSETLNDSVIQNPLEIALVDTFLFSMESFSTSDTLVHYFSTKTGSWKGDAFPYGNGPRDFLSVSSIDMSIDSLSFWAFDITKQYWVGMNVKDISKGLWDNETERTIINLHDYNLQALMGMAWLDDNHFAGNSLLKYKERFFIADTSNTSLLAIENPSLRFNDKLGNGVLADIFSTNLTVTPERSKVVLAGRYLDMIEVYNNKGENILMLKGPERGFDFKFNVDRSLQNSVLVKSSKSKRAYLSVRATNDKIYALYSGKEKKNKEHYSYSKNIYVFSMDGKVLKKYVLDIPILDFVVDENNHKLYAITIDAGLIYFNL